MFFSISDSVALEFPPSTDLLGLTLDLEVAYSSPAEYKDMVLMVKELPLDKIPEIRIKSSLKKYFTKHTRYAVAECHIIDGVGYLSFKDKSGKNVHYEVHAEYNHHTIMQLCKLYSQVLQLLPFLKIMLGNCQPYQLPKCQLVHLL